MSSGQFPDRSIRAFPRPPNAPGGGMLLRDWFAGQALKAFAAGDAGLVATRLDPEAIAKRCYELADAMMDVRDR